MSDSAAESILQVKKVEVEFVPLKQAEMEFVSAIPPMNPDPMHTEEEAAAVLAVVVVAAAAAVPELGLGPIHFDLCFEMHLNMLGGRWKWKYSTVAIVEEVAVRDWNCQGAASYLPPNQNDHRFLQTLNYSSPLLLAHEQRVRHVPQTMNEDFPNDYLSVDHPFVVIFQPHHPWTFAVNPNGNAGVVPSAVSIYTFLE